MAEIYGLDGRKLTGTEADDTGRTQPMLKLDTEEGRFSIPVVMLAGMQYDALVRDIKGAVLEELLPLVYEQLGLPFEEGNVVSGELLEPEG